MAYFFRNQNNYADIPYPSQELPRATVASGGCGVCSACNALDNLLKRHIYSVETMAKFSRANGGRINGGTDMNTLLNALKNKLDTFTVQYIAQGEITSKLPAHLKAGGTAVLSTAGGKTAPNALFSSGGHLYCAAGIGTDGKIHILDSGYYSGKYKIIGREKYVTVNGTEPYLSVSVENVQKASHFGCWLLTKKKTESEKPKQQSQTQAKAKYLYCTTTAGLHFRKGASVNANLVAGANSGKSIIGYGDKVEYIATKGKWKNIKYRGLTGFSHSDYLSEKAPAPKYITVPAGRNLRSAVGLKAKIKTTTKTATKAELLVDGKWYANGYNWSRIRINGEWYYMAKL